ncbi:hypothetical protein CPC08DRAFT_672891 [Agrocybe pediades]|nr:hypothetical protein CPC08DRAFT_672891 [Agrocybe pediades]
MGNYNHYRASVGKGGLELLQGTCTPSAFHNSGEGHVHPPCHPNTRVSILRTIMEGIEGKRVFEDGIAHSTSTPDRFIFLTGPAGAGKSAIASTIAGRCDEEGRLLASFFFRVADPSRNHIRHFFPTIAYQICIAIPQARNYIAAVIERDPLILKKSLSIQLDSLLINPLLHLMNTGMLDASGRYCIVIDGLDECVDKKARCELLEILMSAVTRTNLPFVFFISSRPEYDITSIINSPNPSNISSRLYLDEKYLPNADIRQYLHDNFDTIKAKHPSSWSIPVNWPSDASLDALVRKASGQFIYAATVVKYVSSNQHNPMERLDLVLVPHHSHKDTLFAELDALYMHILSEIEDIDTLLRILSFYLLKTGLVPMDCRLPIWILGYTDIMSQTQTLNVLAMLRSNLCSLVIVEEVGHDDGWVNFVFQVHHASFIDFLCDRRRSEKYYMDLCRWRGEHISAAFRYLSTCKSGIIYNSWTLYYAFRFIKETLHGTCIKTVFHHFPHFSNEDLYGMIFESRSERGLMQEIIRDLYIILRKLEGFPSSPESSALHDKLSQVLDEYLRDTLQLFHLNPELQCFLTILPYATRCSINYRRCIEHLEILYSLLPGDVKDPRIDALYSLLRFNRSSFGRDPEDFVPFIADFLKDPNRAGPSALSGTDYAQMALRCLDFLCNTTFFEQQHLSSRDLARTKRNTPFLSRHRRESLYRLYKITRVHRKRWLLWEMSYSRCEFYHYVKGGRLNLLKTEFKAFRKFQLVGLALRYLPYLLKHSSKHEVLEASARQMFFPPYAFRHPRKLALARKAIANYIVRCLL